MRSSNHPSERVKVEGCLSCLRGVLVSTAYLRAATSTLVGGSRLPDTEQRKLDDGYPESRLKNDVNCTFTSTYSSSSSTSSYSVSSSSC